jgi:hypothetical protein
MRLPSWRGALLAGLCSFCPAACASRSDNTFADGGAVDGGGPAAEGGGLPNGGDVIVEKASFTELFALSDMHAHLNEMVALLERSGLVTPKTRPFVWTGASSTVVIAGDYIDKGPNSLGVIAAIMELETAASAKGGTVISLLGNHEAEFLAQPNDSKFEAADAIGTELRSSVPSIDPTKFATGPDPRAVWLRGRPLAAKVGGYFFCHAGDTHGATIAALREELGLAFRTGSGFADARIIGEKSPLESRAWYTSETVARNLAALGATHVAFGHDPSAFDFGSISAPSKFGGKIIKIDAGLAGGDSAGEMFHVRFEGAAEVAEAIGPTGPPRVLYRSQ